MALGVVGAVLLVYFPPELLFSVTTTTGGDTGAHIYTPWFLRHELLPQGRLSGWAPGWYAGYPILQFYFPLVAVFQAVASFVIPFEVAFKLGTVLGTFFLPVAAWLLFRLLRLAWPAPALAALGALGFLLMDSYSIYGGNIPSSLAGEYGYALSLGLMLVFIGLMYRLATEEAGRPLLAAVVLALTVLSHLLPVIVALLMSPLLLWWAVRRLGLGRAMARFASVYLVAFALTAFWSIPFLVRLPYTTDMGWHPLRGWEPVLPAELWVWLAAGALGAAVAVLRRDRRFLLFALMGLIGLVLYRLVPPGSVWNGRFLPFWYLAAFLAAAYLAGGAMPAVLRVFGRRLGRPALALTVLAALGMGTWALAQKGPGYIDSWIRDNYQGYESRAEFPTFAALNDRLSRLAPGRVFWEPNDGLGRYGTPVALMSIPYFSGQPTMEGINFESSLTTPFHFLTASEVALQPSNPIPGLPYHPMDLDRGAAHMELLDIGYYVSFTDQARTAALEAGLRRIDDVGEFTIFEVDSPGPVVVLDTAPTRTSRRGAAWIERNVEWFGDLEGLDSPLVRASPSEWERVFGDHPDPGVPAVGAVSQVVISNEEIRFRTEAPGYPHWIKTSYFPNWRVSGAEGPYLASPSFMVVVPTQSEVVLSYRWSWTEWSGWLLTAGVLLAVALPASRRRLSGLGNA